MICIFKKNHHTSKPNIFFRRLRKKKKERDLHKQHFHLLKKYNKLVLPGLH